jgi:hypothetical protein
MLKATGQGPDSGYSCNFEGAADLMPADFDLFVVFRWSLATVCTIYAVVVSARSLWNWLSWFAGSRETAVLGRYTFVLILRTKLRRFGWELTQIAFLTVALTFFVYMHWYGGD